MTEDRIQQLLIQVSRAREALGNALGLVQDVDIANFDLSRVTALMAMSVRALFTAQEQNLKTPNAIGDAMKNLRKILQMMQDIHASDAKLQAATTTVARILAILFPVYKELTAAPAPVSPETRIATKSKKASADLDADERRSSPRKSIEVDIGLQSDSNFFTGFTTDISSGGLFVATYDAPAPGQKVNLNFHLPDGPVISVDGEVRWVREYNEITPETHPGVGVRFINLSSADASHINTYIKTVQPMFYDE